MSVQFKSDVEAVDALASSYKTLKSEIGKVIVGQDDVVRAVIISLFSNGHSLLVGVPGLAKTLLVSTISEVLDLSFKRIQFTPDLMPSDITGSEVLDESRNFKFNQGPIFANIVLADEINRTPPKTQAALLEAMQERSVTVAGDRHLLPKPFFVLATQNPIEQEGTYPLPEAQLDRFLFKVDVSFPSANELSEILNRTTGEENPEPQQAADGPRIVAMQNLARTVPVPSNVTNYVSRLIVGTHPEQSPSDMVKQYVRYGSSPRGAQAIMLGARITALLAGRYNVSFEDVEAIAAPALRHRMILNFEAQAGNVSADQIVADLLASVSRES